MLLVCSLCGAPPDFAGFLCLEPKPWDPTSEQYVCKACVEACAAFAAEMVTMAEDAKDRADHVEGCSYCYRNRGLLPPGLLAQACWEQRKAKEARKAVLAC